MPGRTGSSNNAALVRLALAALAMTAAILALAAWSPGAARASGCENSWTNSKGGSWFEKEDWSKKSVPTASEEVCISLNGTYTVTATTETITVKALTIGGGTGTQTLAAESTCGAHAKLTATSGLTIASSGELLMTDGDHCDNNVTVVGAITNEGLLTTAFAEGATSGIRSIQGNLTNTGTIAIDAGSSYNGESTTLTNRGAIDVAESFSLVVSNKASVVNGAGGSIAGGATGRVLLEPKTSFTEGAGTTSGTLPVVVDDGALAYEPSGGESTIAQRGEGSSLSGTTSAKQSLLLQSTCGENMRDSVAAGFANGGSIALTDGESCNNSVTLAVTSGAISNSGTITTSYADGASAGTRSIQGNLTNTGTLTVDAGTSYNGEGAVLSNKGAIDVAEGRSLAVSNKASVLNAAGGSIAGGATGNVFVEPKSAFTEGAGTTSGAVPVVIRQGSLTYEPSGGESTIAMRGENSSISGTTGAKQSLLLQATCGENMRLAVAGGFTNAGSIALTDGESCNNSVTLAVTSGAISNSGTITTSYADGASAGTRSIQGNVTNTGTLTVDAGTSYNGEGAVLSNKGAIDVAEGRSLVLSNKASVLNAAGGSIAGGATGNVFLEPSSAFTEGAGTTTGTLPVIVRDGSLTYEPSGGESTIAMRGEGSALTGAPGAKQALILQSTCGENTKVSAAANLTNAGSVTLTDAEGCNTAVTLSLAEGAVLTNSGTITTSYAHGATAGARDLLGEVRNSGTLAIDANTEMANNSFATSITNTGTVQIANEVSLSVAGKSTVLNEGGTIEAAGSGALAQHGGTFKQGAGKTSGSEPVVLDDSALDYTGAGASVIAVHGESSPLSGNVSAGQELIIASTCGEHAKSTAASFTNTGTIVLTNSGSCGNNATLNLGGGTLTNEGTIDAEEPHGGSRTIEGSVSSERTVAVGAGATLKVTGTFSELGKHALFRPTIAGSSSYGALAVTGAATITRELLLVQVKPFVPTVGERFPILSSAALTGTFTKVKGNKIKKAAAKKYVPIYSGTGVTLEAQ